MKAKRSKTSKARRSRATTSEEKFVAAVERERAAEIKAKIAAARESIAKGRTRKWNLDQFLAEAEKRRKSKLAAE